MSLTETWMVRRLLLLLIIDKNGLDTPWAVNRTYIVLFSTEHARENVKGDRQKLSGASQTLETVLNNVITVEGPLDACPGHTGLPFSGGCRTHQGRVQT